MPRASRLARVDPYAGGPADQQNPGFVNPERTGMAPHRQDALAVAVEPLPVTLVELVESPTVALGSAVVTGAHRKGLRGYEPPWSCLRPPQITRSRFRSSDLLRMRGYRPDSPATAW